MIRRCLAVSPSCLLALALLAFAFFAPAAAAESNLVATSHDVASLVTESDDFVPGQPLKVGLRLRLAPGWHTYWSNPGDAGEAPSISIRATGAATGAGSAIDWPAPRRLPEGPLMSYGYIGDIVLPVTLRLGAAASGALALSADAEWLACSDVCVPEHGSFRLALPQGQAAVPSAQASLFAEAAARRPVPSPYEATFSPSGRLLLSGVPSVSGAWFFPANPGLIDQVATQPVTMTPGHVSIGLRPLAALHGAKSLSGLVVLRDSDGHERYLIVEAPIADGRARGGAPPSHAGLVAPAIAWSALPRLILFALLGGMILNLMPCVFPVLAMKALALSRLSGVERAKARLSAGFYTAGVLVAFALLGALMLVLREAGSTVGWGFQFQSALFVIAICWLLFLVGLNLSGLFEIGLGAIGFGQGLATRDGHAGDFATGLLAVVVASPCTAPFMGVAVAGALAANAAIGMAVFLSMGLGLALPYVLLASSPALAARLPRPGSWMVVLRQALSFPVFASCAWLAWVTAIEGGTYAVLVLASGMVCLAVAGWLLGLAQRWASKRAPAFVVAAGVFAAIALSLLPGLRGVHPAAGAAAPAATQGEPFSESRLALLRARGTPVFVDMTAAWCVTCLLNERVALSPKPVREAFARQHIALLVGDWTSRDSAIAAFLRAHGRDGVPLYVYYPAGAEGRVLPQILTRSIVLREIGGSP